MCAHALTASALWLPLLSSLRSVPCDSILLSFSQDAFFYSLVYDPQQKTLLADKGEIRVGNKYQADITDLLNEGEAHKKKTPCWAFFVFQLCLQLLICCSFVRAYGRIVGQRELQSVKILH